MYPDTGTSSEDTETETCEEPKRPTRPIFHSESMKQQSKEYYYKSTFILIKAELLKIQKSQSRH
ncbi:hypothetical protein BpHYR1_044220 [Brachionus plicatilis]|uniref:Uncharacterized protein n=1 Tax=Brachionus plicatilis TaxID=10195 RepID=A0A3M7P4S5_BRAPC|nr:hypothetical protein BpHYR1_044220 [Brachionus plicatilis]